MKGVGRASGQYIGVGETHEPRRFARTHEPRTGLVAGDNDQELAARTAAGRPEAPGEAIEARFRLNANAAGAIRAGAAEQSADRTLAAGAGELNVAPRGRRQRGEQALGLLDAMPAGFVRLAVEAVGEPEVRARRLGDAPP